MAMRKHMMCAAVCAALAACGGGHDADAVAAMQQEHELGSASGSSAASGWQAPPKQTDTQARPAMAYGSGSGSAAGSGSSAPTTGSYGTAHETASRTGLTGAAQRLAATANVTQGHKLIRHGDLHVIVDGVDGARVKLEQLAEDAGGFVDREEVDHADGHASAATLVLHVPADQFMVVMRGARALGTPDRDETQTEDITEEYTDVASRLSNTKRLEQRLLQLVDTRAGSMEEVLEVENQIADVRGTIEQMEGRIKVWDDQISMSRITVELALQPQKAPAVAVKLAPLAHHKSWWERTEGAAASSFGALADAGTAVAMAGAAALPWIPFALIALLLLRALGRRAARIVRARRLRHEASRAVDAERAAVAAGIAAAMEAQAAVTAEAA